MKKLKKIRCGLFVLFFAASLIGLFIGFSDDVRAIEPEACTTSNAQISNWNWIGAFRQEIIDESMTVVIEDNSWFIGNYTTSGHIDRIYIVDDPNIKVDFKKRGSPNNDYVIYFPPATTYHIFNVFSPDHTQTPETVSYLNTSTAGGSGFNLTTQVRCVHHTRNVNYDASWDQDPLPGVDFTMEEKFPEDCTAFDFGCWLTGLIDSVDEAFQSLFEAIGKFFTWLFVPDPDYIEPLIDNFMDTLQNRLGILWIPFDLLVAFLQVFISGNPGSWLTPNNLYCNGSSSATLFGKTVHIYDFIPYCKVIINAGPPTGYSITPVYPLIELIMNFFRMSVFLAVCGLFYHKVKELLHK